MLNQGLLEGNPSFSFLYLASGGRSLAGKWKNSSDQHQQHDRRPVDVLVSTGRHWWVSGKRGKTNGKGERWRVRAIVRVMGSELNEL